MGRYCVSYTTCRAKINNVNAEMLYVGRKTIGISLKNAIEVGLRVTFSNTVERTR